MADSVHSIPQEIKDGILAHLKLKMEMLETQDIDTAWIADAIKAWENGNQDKVIEIIDGDYRHFVQVNEEEQMPQVLERAGDTGLYIETEKELEKYLEYLLGQV